MLKKLIYRFAGIDESGDLGDSTKFFIIVVFLFDDENLSRKIRKFIQKLNHKKGGKSMGVLHARKDDDIVKMKLVKFLSTFNWKCIAKVENKTKGNFNYLQSLEEVLSESEVIEKIIVTLPSTRADYKYKVNKMRDDILISTPSAENILQISDFLAWSLFQLFERGEDKYFKLLKDNIIFSKNSKTPM